MAYFPLFFDLKGKKVLVVGAGLAAERRIQKLCAFEAEVTVVAPTVRESVQTLAEEGKIQLLSGRYEEYREQLYQQRYFLVLTATGEEKTDALAEEDSRSRGIFVNVAGEKSRSDFYFSGIAEAKPLTVGVIAGGDDHKLAGEITQKLQQWMDEKKEQTERKQER